MIFKTMKCIGIAKLPLVIVKIVKKLILVGDNLMTSHTEKWEEELSDIYYNLWGSHPADKLAILKSFTSQLIQKTREEEQEWRKEYSNILNLLNDTDKNKLEWYNEEMKKEVSEARHQAQEELKEKLRGEIDRMKKGKMLVGLTHTLYGYNQALLEVIKLLEK